MRNHTQTINYLLAFNTLIIIKSTDAKIYTRLNQVEVEARFIDALTAGGDNRDIKLVSGAKKSIDEVISELGQLRKTYKAQLEPSHEFGAYSLEERGHFENKLFDRFTDCLLFINQHNLIPDKTYGEAFAESWSGKDLQI